PPHAFHLPRTIHTLRSDRPRRARAQLEELPYADETFDKVYCISVLEHLDTEVQGRSFEEFFRVLRPEGLAVLTFDHPTVNLDRLRRTIERTGLECAGDVDPSVPENALPSAMWGEPLRCFRAFLRKKAA